MQVGRMRDDHPEGVPGELYIASCTYDVHGVVGAVGSRVCVSVIVRCRDEP